MTTQDQHFDLWRKKPVTITASQWFSNGHCPVWAQHAVAEHGTHFTVSTLEGEMRGEPRDWIIKGVKGEIYPCKPDIFAATYEPANAALAPPQQPVKSQGPELQSRPSWLAGGEEALALAREDAQGDERAIPADCDVRKILLRIVPGDGNGHEVYAQNVADVEALLSGMGQELEEWELGIRRLSRHPSAPASAEVSQAARDVLAERRRQIDVEDWTPEHDDKHRYGSMASAAACYAMFTQAYPPSDPPRYWPWDKHWWKPSSDPQRNLIKAGALILAEIERLDRAALAAAKPEGGSQ